MRGSPDVAGLPPRRVVLAAHHDRPRSPQVHAVQRIVAAVCRDGAASFAPAAHAPTRPAEAIYEADCA